MPVPLKNYAARVEGLLKEYKRVAGGKLILEALDPKPDSDAEESAAANGVEGQSLPNGDSAYLGLAINCLDQSFAIPFLSPERENFLEYDLSSAISRVSRDGKPVLGLISSLPVSGKQAPMVMMGGPRQQEPPWLFYTELKKDYEIRDLGPVFSEIPDEIKTLLVIHPKNLSDSQLYALDQFVLRAGPRRLRRPPLRGRRQERRRRQHVLDALDLLDPRRQAARRLGVKFDAEKAVADLKLATKLRGGGGEVQRDASWLSIAAAQLDKKDPATAQLDSLLMVVAGAFSCETPEGLKKSVLISSSDDSCMVSKFVAQMGGDAIAREFKSDKTVKSLAIRLDGKFKSAFPDGDPSAVKDAKKDAKKPEESKGLKASSKDGSVILVGDVDMLYDAFNSRVQNLFGQSYAVPLNDNVSLLLNAIGALSGDDVLLDLRSRGVKKRPFEVVDAMLANAEKSYRERIKSLETELADAQRSISELRKSKGDVSSQKFIMSPEVKASIEKFRKQELETRAQLKEIRKSLRSEIDSLEMKIKWANMALMPALVALVGIAIGVIRKWRAKA
jgi:ABC-type uncharacterized transport system involved in gliding motility auxiliary subunit